jgi:hypothetical protein
MKNMKTPGYEEVWTRIHADIESLAYETSLKFTVRFLCRRLLSMKSYRSAKDKRSTVLNKGMCGF